MVLIPSVTLWRAAASFWLVIPVTPLPKLFDFGEERIDGVDDRLNFAADALGDHRGPA